MNFKNFLVISLILVSVFFLFGCTSSNCGDGICQSGEESFCYTDCGTILPSTTVSISVIDATSGKLINTNNNIFIELPDKDDLDCSNPFFNTLCEARYYLDSNPKKLETFSVLLGNVDSLLIGVGADGYKMTDVRLNISKDDSSDFTISLEPKDDLLVDLKEGDICEIDSQCYAGNNNYAVCAADIYGIKRCNVNTTINPELNLSSCILDASAFEIKKDKSVCLNETQKVTCTGVEWSKPIDCEGECRNGSCVSEVYSPKTKTFKFLKDVKIVEVVPKEIATTADEISSTHNYKVLLEDPILEFTIPTVKAGEEAEVTYSVNKMVSEAEFASMTNALAKYEEVEETTIVVPEEVEEELEVTQIPTSEEQSGPTGLFGLGAIESIIPLGIIALVLIGLIVLVLKGKTTTKKRK